MKKDVANRERFRYVLRVAASDAKLNQPTKYMTTDIATFATKAEAEAVIAKLDNCTYILAHGEYERPNYTARKIRGEDRYYIFAKRYFYAGTFYAAKSGPVDTETVHYA